ncbi:hypothetical protein GCM10010329_14270 [Streptomyces spiroverticillatus]|uniref:Monooxygenase n=1 Tax=Streptomyces finlayi TaxID=67296 RepID=A0A918X2R7_9ACTN|nr:DUF5990 family protein [Streptomyces finlayi]GGZ94196.1 hypothetical protein GCM10010329_14270 [Streptomyces spiroverticillatus]GHD06626.1 hypothetical protein GCM10010334_58300 [Streptomyces finlayi]
MTDKTELKLRLVGHDLPGRDCGEFRNVHVAVQRKKDPEGPVRGDAPEAVWDLTLDVLPGPDFRGPYVHGRPGERFLYLTWGEVAPDGTFEMFRRAKIFCAEIPAELLARGRAEGRISLTDAKGMPLCAAVRPPTITWS